MTIRVLVPQPVPDSAKDMLRQKGYEVVDGTGFDEETMAREVQGCQVMTARTAPVTRSLLERASDLRVISRFGVGVDNIDLQAAADLGIWVANTPQANSISVAEHTMAMIMALATKLPYAHNQTRNGNFACRAAIMGTELFGKTLAIAGLGRIGRHLARIAGAGLGMKVIAYDPYVAPGAGPEGVEMVADLDALLSRGDVVSLHFPATPETKNSFGAAVFAKMKKSAMFVNCARGEVVVEADLIDALRSGTIAGAALDVFDKEPPQADNPLFAMDNVVVSPHTASSTSESFFKMGEHMAQNIISVIETGKPVWPVNKPASPRR